MRACVAILGAVVSIVLGASSCGSSPPVSSCVVGSEQCGCNAGKCDEGLSCVSGTCFDIGELGSKESASTQAPRRGPGRSSGSPSADAGDVEDDRSGSQRFDAGAARGSKAGAGALTMDAGVLAAGGGSGGGSDRAAASDSGVCAAPGTSCADKICCQGASCINNDCRVTCLGNSDCSSHCCVPFDATRSVCREIEQCSAAQGGSGGGGSGGGTAGSAGSAGASSQPGSCSAAGAECGAQGCCDGVSCVNNICAAPCETEQDCASNCCLSFFAGAEKACVPQTLCRRR